MAGRIPSGFPTSAAQYIRRSLSTSIGSTVWFYATIYPVAARLTRIWYAFGEN